MGRKPNRPAVPEYRWGALDIHSSFKVGTIGDTQRLAGSHYPALLAQIYGDSTCRCCHNQMRPGTRPKCHMSHRTKDINEGILASVDVH